MNLWDGMKVKNTILNSKGSEYYETSYDANLDLFAKISRFNEEYKILDTFCDAYEENSSLALSNLLYILDIRDGKGERRIFKIIYSYLCNNHPDDALKILPLISKLGRYDYILVGIDTPIESNVISLIKEQLEYDLKTDNPSLLAKWLPSHRSHNTNNELAKKLIKLLGMSEKEYRVTLSTIRSKLNIVEKNLTNRDYENIDFNKVPSKAMLKYNKAYTTNMSDMYNHYKESLNNGESEIKTTGLFSYEIVKRILFNKDSDNIYDYMWKNQKEIFDFNPDNILVVADTSGSMTNYNYIPYCTSIGLAIYISERNKGIYKNKFITFSEKPVLQEIKGDTISEKIKSMKTINAYNTDIDKVFKIIIDSALENNISNEELPSHIIIISDMEFDSGVASQSGTNFSGWKQLFESHGYKLPNIIFWNVACDSKGLPVTMFDNDVALISGFSTSILESILSLDKYNPVDVMLEKLKYYTHLLNKVYD